jgi:uncharacterized protein (DUF1330 family)
MSAMSDPFAFHRTEIGGLAIDLMSPRADEGPIYMLNLLRYKADGGEAAYREYAEANIPLVERFGVEIVVAATPAEALIGKAHWHMVLVVRYPTRQAFIDMLNTALYEANEPIRTRALEDSELHVMDPLGDWDHRKHLQAGHAS